MMRKNAILLTALAAMMTLGGSQIAAAGENSFGLRVGFNTRNSVPVAGLWFRHSFNSHFRLSPSADYHFCNNNTDALALNCNAQFPFALGESRFKVYPFAGLNYTSWNLHREKEADEQSADDVTTRFNRFGLNIGAGAEYQVSPTMVLTFEAKTTLIKSYSSGCFTLGIGYCF